jgi:thiamine biosynthesis lipoprotein
MRSRLNIEIRRCRPLLGTFVDVACQGSPEDVDCAFGVVEKVHRLMSFHDPSSDVTRMNRHASHQSVKVHPWTWCVLKCAQEFSSRSNGVFDITIAPELVKLDFLPTLHNPFEASGRWKDIVLEDECVVRFRRRVIIDLGGIAKGFAVDRAVETLKGNGVAGGVVNAGGDLRILGAASQFVHVRHPAEPMRIAGTVRLRDGAMASSGIYFGCRRFRGQYMGPLVNGRSRQFARELLSVSVAAPECMIADALTKIVFALREKAADLLAQCGAGALLIERDGARSWMFHSLCDTRDRTRFA